MKRSLDVLDRGGEGGVIKRRVGRRHDSLKVDVIFSRDLTREQLRKILDRKSALGLRDSRHHDFDHRRQRLPRLLRVDPKGVESETGLACHFFPVPFPFCLSCGVAYAARQRSDFGKLTSLGMGGRSTATTILTLAAILYLRSDETLAERARKILSFTDNRQDAALQAGHFNDFVEVSLLRAALYRAIQDAGEGGVSYDALT